MKEINLLHEARLDSNAPLLFAALLPHFERNYKYNANDRITRKGKIGCQYIKMKFQTFVTCF